MDYPMPRADEMPPLEVIHMDFPSAINPLGIKGVGESGVIRPPPRSPTRSRTRSPTTASRSTGPPSPPRACSSCCGPADGGPCGDDPSPYPLPSGERVIGGTHDRAPAVRTHRAPEQRDPLRRRRAGARQPGRGRPRVRAPVPPRGEPHRHRRALRRLGASHRAVDGPAPERFLPRHQDGQPHRRAPRARTSTARSSACASITST